MAGVSLSLPGPEDLAGWQKYIDRLEPPIEGTSGERGLQTLRKRMLAAIANMSKVSGRRTKPAHPARYEGPYPNRTE